MKLFITLMVLTVSSNVFAEGAYELKCTSKEGISLHVSNGISEMEVLEDSGRISKTNIIVEDYDNGVGAGLEIRWSGDRTVLSDSIDNVDGVDHATTTFTQTALVQNFGVTIVSAEMTCTDSVITTSGILNEQI